jgi:hypothetical protein
LGSYYTDKVKEGGALSLPTAFTRLANISFAEVYWANIAHTPEKTGYALDASNRWVDTTIERLILRARSAETQAPDYSTAKLILREMIEGLTVIENLLFLAKKAGILDLQINRLLTNYVGDVQIVTEFAKFRDKILKAFSDLMTKIHGHAPVGSQIYIVAHSEGTVVALLVLMTALGSNGIPDWARQVKGLMTIGSPLDKHKLLTA